MQLGRGVLVILEDSDSEEDDSQDPAVTYLLCTPLQEYTSYFGWKWKYENLTFDLLGQATVHLACPSGWCHCNLCIYLHCTALNCSALHCTAHHCTALQQLAVYWILLYCTSIYCTALCYIMQCIALHCTELPCNALHCTALKIRGWAYNTWLQLTLSWHLANRAQDLC